jgi:hypothetical protein
VTYESDMPLEEGSWLAIDGVYLVVERLIAGKRGDPYVAVALCKLTVG